MRPSSRWHHRYVRKVGVAGGSFPNEEWHPHEFVGGPVSTNSESESTSLDETGSRGEGPVGRRLHIRSTGRLRAGSTEVHPITPRYDRDLEIVPSLPREPWYSVNWSRDGLGRKKGREVSVGKESVWGRVVPEVPRIRHSRGGRLVSCVGQTIVAKTQGRNTESYSSQLRIFVLFRLSVIQLWTLKINLFVTTRP